ncbi:MAG: hypothetical protein HQM03_16865 [Magnetococcales bacterium]|nr:hypothetical protein [Magnetococcales bacterium]
MRRWLPACAGLLLLTSCTWTPPWHAEPEVRVSGTQLADRYRLEQERRRQGPSLWGMEGILDLETPDQARRNRIDMVGSGALRIRMRAYGPFHQIAMELLVGTEWIRLVDPGRKTITQVPANAAGMEHLIGLPLPPEHLHRLLMGWAAEVRQPEGVMLGGSSASGIEVVAGDGERLRLEPVTGRILERSGEVGEGRRYQAAYVWPEGGGEAMPERILVTLDRPAARMEVIRKRWFQPKTGPDPRWFEEEPPVGFELRHPLDGGDP